MRNTKWMVLCLMIGFVMASALLSTIPIYMNASLQRMLVKDMEELQLEKNVYPGIYGTEAKISLQYDTEKALEKVNEYIDITQSSFDELGMTALNSKLFLVDEYDYVSSLESEDSSHSTVRIGTMTNIADHISFIDGRMYESGQRSDGVYEVIATEQALKISGLAINTVYDIANSFDTNAQNPFRIEIVGIFTAKDSNDSYWSEGIDATYLNTVFMDYDAFMNGPVAERQCVISNFAMRYSINYQDIDMTSLEEVNKLLIDQKKAIRRAGMSFDFPAQEILVNYEKRAAQLQKILWLIQIPVMLMIVFYLYMVSQLNVEQEKNEIAVFKSRGSSSLQIFEIYALESLILGAFTAAIGPFVAMGLCRVLGASNGFLEFVNRTALPIRLSLDAFLYSLLAAAVFFLTTMTPIIPAAKTTIVIHKQSKTRRKKRPLWEKLFLDIILLGGSIGWLYYYNYTREQSGNADVNTINPMLFVASTAFILGAALFVVRIYPLIIRIVYRIGRKHWSPAAYVSLNNIGRSSTGRERFLMVFLTLTVSLGIFFANTARALNRNSEEKAVYSIGCDAVIQEEWSTQGVTMIDDEGNPVVTSSFAEPLYERFSQLAGVSSTARVYTNNNINIDGETINRPERNTNVVSSTYDCRLMAVIPGEFANTVTAIDRLFPVHINTYLNGLSECRSGVILSSIFRDKYTVKQGDTVTVSWGDNAPFEAVVIGFVEYWPTINPYSSPEFAIMNLDYVLVQTAPEPYSVWLNLDDGATTAALYDSIRENNIKATSVTVASQKIIEEKNDPMLQGLNGALTLGFITIMIMCIIGFLIYWILSIKSRTLQFGILRAMGMSFGEIVTMILYEQLLVSAVAIMISFVIGHYAGILYIPLFESLYSAGDMVPALEVIPLRSDYIKIYVIIGVMLLIGFAVLGRLISKINISKALKLGEE